MTYYYFYRITNLVNNKKYLGIHKTINLNDGYLGSGILIKNAIKKYGRENFKKEILIFCKSYEDLIFLEELIITKEITENNNYYNLDTGGKNGEHSQQTKNKIRESINNSEKFLKAKNEGKFISRGNLGKTHKGKYTLSEEAKQKIRNAKIGNKNPMYGVAPWNKGLKTSNKVK